MKLQNIRAVAVILASLQISAFAQLGPIVIGEMSVEASSRCIEPLLSPEEIYLYTESNALLSCGGLDVERISNDIHKLSACDFDKGGPQFRQVLYTCVPNDNPDALFDGGSRLLSSESNKRRFGLIYMTSSCIDFDILGLSLGDTLPVNQLQQLANEMLVQEGQAGSVTPISAQILLKDKRPSLRYKRTHVGIRSGSLLIESKSGKSINEIIASTLGKSIRTGFPYRIRVSPVQCQ